MNKHFRHERSHNLEGHQQFLDTPKCLACHHCWAPHDWWLNHHYCWAYSFIVGTSQGSFLSPARTRLQGNCHHGGLSADRPTPCRTRSITRVLYIDWRWPARCWDHLWVHNYLYQDVLIGGPWWNNAQLDVVPLANDCSFLPLRRYRPCTDGRPENLKKWAGIEATGVPSQHLVWPAAVLRHTTRWSEVPVILLRNSTVAQGCSATAAGSGWRWSAFAKVKVSP